MISHDVLHGRWKHAHEEDTADTRVYRPASYAFKPSRTRDSFELKADGTMVDYGIGPTDRPLSQDGRWELGPGDELTLRSGPKGAERVLHVISATPDRLVVKR